jgi:ribonuclease HII
MRKIIVGIDEAGRGPLAGPVVAAAFVLLDTKLDTSKLRDSKVLSAKQRESIYTELHRHPAAKWGIGQVSEKHIDKINIYQATRLAMKKAVLALEHKLCGVSDTPHNSCLIIDGNMALDLPMIQKAIVKADTTVPECMAASIVAKVTRDRLMLKLHKKYPIYGFDRHKGYGTAYHMEMLKRHGVCPIHRRSFAPCR